MMTRAQFAAVAGALLSFAVESHAELLPAGPEFPVSATDVVRATPTVDHFANGNVLAVWVETAGCCADVPIKGRIFDADGVPTGPEFPFAVVEYGGGLSARVVPPGDRFVAVRNSGSPRTVGWRLYDSTGTPLGPEVTLPTSGDAYAGGVAVDANGNLAFLYSDTDIKLQRYTMAGVAVGAPTLVADLSMVGLSSMFGVEAGSDGNLVVAWSQSTVGPGNGSPTGWVRRYDTSGVAVGTDWSFDGPHDDGYLRGQLETDAVGHVYTVFTFLAGPTSDEESSYHVTRFSLDGSNALEYAFEAGSPDRPAKVISATPDGRLAVVWKGNLFSSEGGSATEYLGIHDWIAQYAADGSPAGPPLPLTDRLYGLGTVDSISVNANGSAFVGYTTRDFGGGNPPPKDALLQRYCDTNDTGCALCPAFDDDVDTDGDRIPDGCDPCSNVAGGQNAIVSKTSVSYGIELRERRVVFDESFVLPAGTSFADLDIVAEGARLRIESVRGQAMFDAVLPGGTYGGSGTRGWTATPTKLKYSDRTDSLIDGVKRVMIVDQNRKEQGRVRVKARAGGGEYFGAVTHMPMKAIAVLGDATAAAAGMCGEFPYTAEQCEAVTWNANRCLGVAE